MNRNLKKIYEKNKYLDNIFEAKYGNDEEIFKKNCIEFLVELGEFVNETKCFKYWSIKEPNFDKVLEEYADTITMVLYFYNKLNLNLDDLSSHIESNNELDVINYIYKLGTDLILDCNENLLKDIFSNLLYLGELFGLKEDSIIEAINKKHMIIEERLNTDY